MIGFVIKLVGGLLISCCLGWAINRHYSDREEDDDHPGSYSRLQGETSSRSNLHRVSNNINNTSHSYRPSIPSSTSPFPSKVAEHPTLKKNEETPARRPLPSKLPAVPITKPSPASLFPKETSSFKTSPFPSKAAGSSTLTLPPPPLPLDRDPSLVIQSSWSSPSNSAKEKQKDEETPATHPLPSKLHVVPIAKPSPALVFSEETSSSFKAPKSPMLKPTLRPVPPSESSTGGGAQDKYIWVQKGKSPVYEIPEDVECLIKHDEVPQVLLRKPLSASTYRDYFAALLYAEDHYLEKWSDFELFDVHLELKPVEVYDKIRSTNYTRNPKHDKTRSISYTLNRKHNKTLASFVIDAVREKRPFLLSRDFVFTRPSDEPNNRKFQGLIYRVERSNTILVEFGQDFFSQHQPTSKYDVSFSFNRVCLKRFHEAIKVASARSCLRGFIFPDSLSGTRTSMATSVSTHMFNHRLDKQQRVAVDQILSLHGPPPYLVEGQLAVKPDTSTTTTTKQQLSRTGLVVKEAVAQLYQSSADHRILVCAHANRTCDVLMEHFKEEIMDGDMFRANAAFREIDGVPSEILSQSAYKGECFTCPPLHELQRFRVIVSTYVTSFRLHSEGIGSGHFSHIFLVDASTAIEPEVMVAVVNFVGEETAVIVSGSKATSPHLVRSDIARKYGLKTSYFERLRNCSKLYSESSGSARFISRLEEGSHSFTPFDCY